MLSRPLLILVFPLLLIGTSVVAAKHNYYVAEEHGLFQIEKRARTESLQASEDLERFAVRKGDSVKDAYRNLILLERYTKKMQSIDSGDRKEKVEGFFIDQLETAHNAHPGSAPIATIFAYHKFFADRDLVASMAILIPYIQERDLVPGIVRSIADIFVSAYRTGNLRAGQDKLRRILGLESEDSNPNAILKLLSTYWILRINPSFSSEWTSEDIDRKDKKFSREEARKAYRAWEHLIRSCYGVNRLQLRHQIIKQIVSERQKRAKRQKEESLEYEEKMQKRAREELESLEEQPNHLKDIFSKVNKLKVHSGKESVTDRIPNYSAIKRKIGKFEADLVNAFYLQKVLNKRKEASAIIDRLIKEKPEDQRILLIKAARALDKKNPAVAKKALKKVLDQDSDNYRAKHMMIEVSRLQDKQSE